jgi:hypothetical protein
MEKPNERKESGQSGPFRYAWPVPMGIFFIMAGHGVARFLGQRAFLNVHFWLEIGFVVSMLSSVVYAIRLGGNQQAGDRHE